MTTAPAAHAADGGDPPAAAPRPPAEDPGPLSADGQITDRAGALGNKRGAVATALNQLYTEHRIQLFVVYVRDFSGRASQSWADTTASRNGLGRDDVLLAVATQDRQFAYSVGNDSRLTDAQLADVSDTAIKPALRQNDWAGAAIGAANGYGAVLSGSPVPTPTITPGTRDTGGEDGVAGDLVLPVVAVGGAGALAAYAYSRRKKKDQREGKREGAGAAGPVLVPLAELDTRARKALVETDDAARTSEEELGFATAQFGEEAARPFSEALDCAKGELTAAFRIRQQLDDAFPEDDPTKRRMLDEILTRCAEANRRLDAESEDFDRLRELERNAPAALESAEAAFRELTGRTSTAEATLTAMTGRYADSAAAPVAGHVEQAKDRLVFATTNLNQARQSLVAGDNSKAAVFVRAAEGAVDQVGTLVDSVERRALELAEAAGKLEGALTETETDLADAGGLVGGTSPGTGTADLQGRIARAQAVVRDVRQEVQAGRYDPIDALRRVEEADAALDEALSGTRERENASRRARDLLGQATLTARATIGAAADYISTHRGAVGSHARTRLAEAQRHLEQSAALAADDDASAALTEAQQADSLARQAQELAQRDVQGYGGGGFGGGGGRGGGGQGGGLNGAVLGGIILGGILNGGRGGGGYGGGGFGGGGFGGGGFGGGPGSFGGGDTRGRRGGGGRF
ncbi:TPM domain-containing protein [Streptomyces sp. NPDC051561]|uniref:TPM domain-containing protein n=1 Tax=Streptomyces sp. NPDC051561 TaxID=3365658 RepID=UPI003797935E